MANTIYFLTALLTLSSINIASLEISTKANAFSIDSFDDDPSKVFKAWHMQTFNSSSREEKLPSFIATASKSGDISINATKTPILNIKEIPLFGDERSEKFQQIKGNPQASIVFSLESNLRQITVAGKCVALSREDVVSYFYSLSREDQAAILASSPGSSLSSYDYLVGKQKGLLKSFEGKEIPCPMYLVGYRLVVEKIVFEEVQPNNLNFKVEYNLKNGKWTKQLINP